MLVVIAIFLLLFVLSPTLGIIVVGIAVAFEFLELVFWRRYLRGRATRTGVETMPGEVGVVMDDLAPDGTVRLNGAIWKAHSETPAPKGHRVRVTAVDGLTLDVEPADG